MGAVTFAGFATAPPATVMHFSTRGIPVLTYLATEASVVQLTTATPQSMGSFPSPITRPVVL